MPHGTARVNARKTSTDGAQRPLMKVKRVQPRELRVTVEAVIGGLATAVRGTAAVRGPAARWIIL
jgi:hypothetical protein